jgi:hypothetical protein
MDEEVTFEILPNIIHVVPRMSKEPITYIRFRLVPGKI